MTDRLVHPAVPDELWLSVISGQIDENDAIARGLLAAGVKSDEERRQILFGRLEQVPAPLPPPGYRPCGRPPWGEP
jgi:hypothetical protein